MYKIGDKVETPIGIGTIKWIDKASKNDDEGFDTMYVSFNGFPEIEINERHIKPYRTAHEKLIELGYEFTKRNDYAIYTHDDLPRVTIYSDKTYSCSDTNLELSRILTQYLEELLNENISS